MGQEKQGMEILPGEVKVLARCVLSFAECRLMNYRGGCRNNDRGTIELISFMRRILGSEKHKIFLGSDNSHEEANRKVNREFQEKQNHGFVRRALVTCTLLYSRAEILTLRELIENSKVISPERRVMISDSFFKS